jgi:nucleoside-diphosphate-sugar epimerase
VTGAAGFIGRSLVRRLLAEGYETVLLIEGTGERKPPIPDYLIGFGQLIQTYSGDLRDRGSIEGLIRKSNPDSVIHLAAAGVTDPFLDYKSAIEHNVVGTINLVHSFFAAQTDHQHAGQMIVARTPGETSNMNVYAASKAAAWAFCSMYAQTKSWPIAGALIYQAYGPGQPDHTFVTAAMKAALAAEDLKMTSGAQQRDWIYVEDVAGGFIAALESNLAPGVSFELGTGISITVADMAEKIYQMVDKGGKPRTGSLANRPGEVTSQIADAERTERLLGWRSSTSVADGLKLVLDALISPGEIA